MSKVDPFLSPSRTLHQWRWSVCWLWLPGRHVSRVHQLVYPWMGNSLLAATLRRPFRHNYGHWFVWLWSYCDLCVQHRFKDSLHLPSGFMTRLLRAPIPAWLDPYCANLAAMLWCQNVHRWQTDGHRYIISHENSPGRWHAKVCLGHQ